MFGITVSQAALLCGGKVRGEYREDAELKRIVIDSRIVTQGDMFVAFKGERADGHDYIPIALNKGAACCLGERVPEGTEGPVIVVPDVIKALEQICAGYRQKLDIPVVGITGSVGKTTAKEMVWAVLSQRFNTAKTEGNYNNQIGVPMTLSRIEREHEAAVVEMGISGFGEMRSLAAMVRPTMAVFTVIGHAHLEFLHDLEGVFKAKTEMLELMEDNAPVIVNGDDEWLCKLSRRPCALTYGMGENCQVRAENVELLPDGSTACRIVYGERVLDVSIPAYGKHMVYAALEGACIGFVMGLTDDEIVRGIGSYATVGRRGAVTDTGFVTLVDDSYNANPDSMRCAVDSLMKLPGRHICILGDMLEMGADSGKMHETLGRYAVEQGAELVVCCGAFRQNIAKGAGERAVVFDTKYELIAALPGLLRRGDAVLVKASRGVKLEQVSDAIKELHHE